MAKIVYSKSALTFQEQLEQLEHRGLTITDSSKSLFLLEHISYYRLSGYWYPLLSDKVNHIFKKDATFNAAFAMYCFDKELRKLALSELEKIEVAIRAKMTYVLSHKHGPFWFEDSSLFPNQKLYQKTMQKIRDEFMRSDEDFVRSYKNKYIQQLPPSWMLMEIISFGSLSLLYQCLKPGREKREIAHHFGLVDSVFASWLHSVVYLRNVCAHHARLWNRILKISPQIPKSLTKNWINDGAIQSNRTYFMLCIIRYLLLTVNPNSSFTVKLKSLFAAYPTIDQRALGCSSNWEKEPLWQ